MTRVHDAHGLGGYTCIRVHLLQYLLDVDGVGLVHLGLPLIVSCYHGFAGSLFGIIRLHAVWSVDLTATQQTP